MGYFYQNVNPSFSHTAVYQYDSLNRLASAVATGNLTYNLAFSYDRFGNMTCQTNGQTQGLCPAYSITQANNRITNTGYSYDAAGDLTADGSHTYQWDAEGRFATEDGGATEVHTYNALGARARIVSQGTPLDLFSDPAGKPLGTNGVYSLTWPLPGHAADIYYQGYDAEFFHANGLGSTTMESNAAGTVSEHLMFYPWGQLWALAGGGGYNFASIPYRDVVSDLDLARFRDYSYGAGRWLSPDPDNAGAHPSNPQSWNAYSYAGNNPTTNTDPSGLDCVYLNSGGTGVQGVDQLISQSGCTKNGGYWAPGAVTDFSIGANGNYVFKSLTESNSGDLVQHTTQYAPTPDAISPEIDPITLLVAGAYGIVKGAAGEGLGALGRMIGIGAEETGGVVESEASATGEAVVASGAKGVVRDAIDNGPFNSAVKSNLKRQLQAIGNNATVTVERLPDGSARISWARPGFEGSQKFVKLVDSSGRTVSVTQYGYDSAGSVVHVDRKF